VRKHESFDFEPEERPRGRRGRRRFDDEPGPGRRGRLTEEERERLARLREDRDPADLPPDGDRWSTWTNAEHGPEPFPDWVSTSDAAVDTELGVLKTGKEADVHLLSRGIPGTPDACLLAAKRYRSSDHRLFHRDAGYLEGRRMRRSREMRAMESRSAFGRNLIAERWVAAEFGALGQLWTIGAPVPYPVQRDGTELLMEFIGSPDGAAAPQLARLRPDPDELHDWWNQLVTALLLLAGQGVTHGDLSAYNIIIHSGTLMLIDLPQLVDIVVNPQGIEFLRRDVANISAWFRSRGLSAELADAEWLVESLCAEAGLR
jgi:RIO kinase 1